MNSKDTRLSFRVRSELKEKLESIAASEGRSVAQICDAFLQAGLIAYGKEGSKYIRRFLARRNDQSQDR
jgi:predicted transcriptional regulator